MKKLLPFLFLVSCSPKEVEEYNFGQCLDVCNTSIFKKAEAHEISRRSQLKIVSFHSNGGMGHGTGTYLTYKDNAYMSLLLEAAEPLNTRVIVGVPMFLIILQPDMGTTLTFLPPLILLMFLAGMRYKFILLAVLSGIASLPVFWLFLKPYQKSRILTFVDPSLDPQGAGWQMIQSKIAVGSGRLFGKGLFSKQTQAYLDYIPEKHTDFVFSVLAENFGLFGVSIALGLYLVVVLRMLTIARESLDRAGTFLVMGILAVFFFHFTVNIGMIVGLMPITGLPLPLMSYGGSSLLATYAGLAIIMSVRMRRFVN